MATALGLNISTWNVQGGLVTKIRDDEFLRAFSADFVCLTETWCTYDNVNNLCVPKDYVHLYSCRRGNQSKKGHGGGISVFFHERFKNIVQKLDTVNEDFLFFKIDKHLFSWDNDLYVGVIYVPPENSPRIKTQ